MLGDRLSPSEYARLMQALEKQNSEYLELLNSREYRLGSKLLKIMYCIRHREWRKIRGFFRNIRASRVMKNTRNIHSPEIAVSFSPEDYVAKERIVVYTSIFGKYDSLQEPVYTPDNIDYRIITDQNVPKESAWKAISWKGLCDEKLTNVEKNRYFKMHPEKVFQEYRYSIYIDGNIKVISDLTPYIGQVGMCGIAMHCHSERTCVYEELDAIVNSFKASKANANGYKKYLENAGMPKNYGLLECNVIVREHANPICQKVMAEWWLQFITQIKRDQVSLPYILYKNNISIRDVATLGNNVYQNGSFRVVRHT